MTRFLYGVLAPSCMLCSSPQPLGMHDFVPDVLRQRCCGSLRLARMGLSWWADRAFPRLSTMGNAQKLQVLELATKCNCFSILCWAWVGRSWNQPYGTSAPGCVQCHAPCIAASQTLQGLALFKGGVLMVSHDQHLIESTVDELWAVESGRGEGLLPPCCRTHA